MLRHRLMKPAATMENLPEELKEEILVRLPVRSLLSLKCVSKSWRSIISNPNFVKLHLQLSTDYSQAQYPNRLLLITSAQVRSLDINASLHNDSNTFNLVFPAFRPCSEVYVVGSCRGTVLLLIKNKDLFLWNPVTGDSKNISLPPQFKLPIPFAFCYDESLDDYFIGLSDYSDHPYNMRPQPFEVLSLTTNSWQKLNLTHHYRKLFQNNGTIFNGAIHFIAYTCRPYSSLELIAFDITTKDLRKVPPPITYLQYPDLGVYKGFLTLTGATQSGIFIWMMREYGVKSSWTMLFSLSRCQFDIGFVHPFVFFKEGDEFVTSYCTKNYCEGLSKWNDRGELLEHRTYGPNKLPWSPRCIEYWTRAIAYTETLLPLP